MNADNKAELAKVKKEDEVAKIIDKALRENASASSASAANSCSTPVIQQKREAAKARGEIFWEDWSEDYVKQLVAKGCPVYIDFTADWCVICKVNKKRVFSSEAVVKRFHELGIITLIGDNTEFRDDIAEILEVYERPGVPLNLLYTKDSAEPFVFPESFGPDEMNAALDERFKL
jgi:thiol:disulfide interchange protein